MTATAAQRDPRERSALRTVVAAFGVIVAIAGLEHGIGEILQGPAAPANMAFPSWVDVAAFDILGGEPAMSVIPNLMVSGVLTIAVSIAIAAWCLRFVHRPHGGPVLADRRPLAPAAPPPPARDRPGVVLAHGRGDRGVPGAVPRPRAAQPGRHP